MLDMRHGLKQSVMDDAFGHQFRVIDDTQLMSVVYVPVHVFRPFLVTDLRPEVTLMRYCACADIIVTKPPQTNGVARPK